MDAWSGELSSWHDYAVAGVAGAVAGESGLYSGPVIAGALSGGAYVSTRSALQGNTPSLPEVGFGMVTGAAGGFVAGRAFGVSAKLQNARLLAHRVKKT